MSKSPFDVSSAQDFLFPAATTLYVSRQNKPRYSGVLCGPVPHWTVTPYSVAFFVSQKGASEMQKSGIYRITNRVSGKVYIGSSANIPARLSDHLNNLRKGTHRNRHLQNSFSFYGEAAFEIDVAEYIDDISDLIPREQYWIDSIGLDKLYNINPFANKPPGMKGRTQSAEARKKVSLASKGRIKSTQERIKLSLANTGKSHTKESREKMSRAKTGKAQSADFISARMNRIKRAVKQIDPITGKVIAIFPSIKEAGAAVGLKSSAYLCEACRDNRLKAAGYRWEYVKPR